MLVDVVHSTRELLLWPLNQLDRDIGISFDSDFNFALSALLFKGKNNSFIVILTFPSLPFSLSRFLPSSIHSAYQDTGAVDNTGLHTQPTG